MYCLAVRLSVAKFTTNKDIDKIGNFKNYIYAHVHVCFKTLTASFRSMIAL